MVFTFWEGDRPAYIDLCLQTWRFPFTVITYQNLHKYTDIPVDRLSRFTLPQISDVVRVHVLRDHGGHWLDADTIMIGDVLPDENILGNPIERTNSIGYLFTEAGSDMFVKWAEFQDDIIGQKDPPTHWSVFGNDFTNVYMQEHPEITIRSIRDCFPETYMIPGSISRYKKYLKFYFEDMFHLSDIKKTDMLMLHNSWTPTHYKYLNAKEALERDCTLSNILREVLT